MPAGYTLFEPGKPAATVSVSAETKPISTMGGVQDQGLLGFALVAFGFGLAAVFTPCVFPMIPITVSFFLNRQSGSRTERLPSGRFRLGIIVYSPDWGS
jgi:thiol:disulfide interchange protein DsbD